MSNPCPLILTFNIVCLDNSSRILNTWKSRDVLLGISTSIGAFKLTSAVFVIPTADGVVSIIETSDANFVPCFKISTLSFVWLRSSANALTSNKFVAIAPDWKIVAAAKAIAVVLVYFFLAILIFSSLNNIFRHIFYHFTYII